LIANIVDDKKSFMPLQTNKEKKMKLSIFGSTGGTGRQIVAQALEHGHDVTAFARSPEKLDQRQANLEVIKGDVLDFTSAERAVQGQDAVLCTLGLPPLDKSNLRSKGTKNIIRAMEKFGVKRFICQSTAGVGDSRDTLPFLMKYLIVPFLLRSAWADHEIQENHIKESPLEWIIVRPAALTDGGHTGSYQHGVTADNKTVTNKISRADTADFMLKQVEDNRYLYKTPCISY
jgi:putative NADH-flavin reductase